MFETTAKIAETAAKKVELAKEIERLEKEIKSKENILNIELNNGQSTVATAEGLKYASEQLKLKTSELNSLN